MAPVSRLTSSIHCYRKRCIAIKLKFNNVTFIIFNVYFPSYYDSYLYRDEISSLTGFIENVLLCNTYDKIIILGDTNFDINLNNAGFKIFNSLLTNADLCACDDLVQGPVINTYANDALGSTSR